MIQERMIMMMMERRSERYLRTGSMEIDLYLICLCRVGVENQTRDKGHKSLGNLDQLIW